MIGVEIRRNDDRRTVGDLELENLGDDLVQHERIGELLARERLGSPERDVSNPGVLRINLPLQEHGQRIDNQGGPRALGNFCQRAASRGVMSIEDQAIDRSPRVKEAGSQQIGEHLVVAMGWSDEQPGHSAITLTRKL